MNKAQTEGFAALGGCVVIVAVAIAAPLINGTAISILWNWFVPPINGPHIHIAEAIGLSILVDYFLSGINLKIDRIEKENTKNLWQTILNHLVTAPLIALGIGYIVHRFFL